METYPIDRLDRLACNLERDEKIKRDSLRKYQFNTLAIRKAAYPMLETQPITFGLDELPDYFWDM